MSLNSMTFRLILVLVAMVGLFIGAYIISAPIPPVGNDRIVEAPVPFKDPNMKKGVENLNWDK